jgi:hypothetical protein
MDLKGNIEMTVEKDSNGDNMFSYPMFVTTNSHSIYISDDDNINDVVLRFNWQGEMIGIVRFEQPGSLTGSVGIVGPSGITLLDDGSLLVNGHNSHCIHRVSGDCKDSKTIVEDVDSPWAACWCAETRTLCVSRFRTGSFDNYIKLYEMM